MDRRRGSQTQPLEDGDRIDVAARRKAPTVLALCQRPTCCDGSGAT